MARVFIGIGTNIGDRQAQMDRARSALAKLPESRLVAFSPVYETAPVGPVAQAPYLNAAAELATRLAPEALLDQLNAIEKDSGRQDLATRVKWGPRTLDLDILLYDGQILQTPRLTVPHPWLHDRWFVLRPLADLAPDVVHPLLQKSVQQMLSAVERRTIEGGPPSDTANKPVR